MKLINKTVLLLLGIFAMNNLLADEAPINWANKIDPNIVNESVLFLPIANPKVKKIPIENINEDLIDLQDINNPRLIPLGQINNKYKNSYSDYSKIRKGVYNLLLGMLEELSYSVGIAYFEGFRPLSKQKEYFDKKFKETLDNISDKGVAYNETSKLISPFIDNTPVHCTGAAIDMTLFKVVKGKPVLLDMGKFDVIFGVNEQQETFSNNITQKQKDNRLMLLQAAAKSGLVNYGYEWWHYSYGDRAWAYVKGKKSAKYALAVDSRDPILQINKESYIASISNQIE